MTDYTLTRSNHKGSAQSPPDPAAAGFDVDGLTNVFDTCYYAAESGCYTSGADMPDAVDMAQDKKHIPVASNPHDIELAGGEFISVVAVDTETYRRFYENKSVKKTLTISMWLNERAERANINFSGILQEALKVQLHIQE